MRLFNRITSVLFALSAALPAYGHDTGGVHDHGLGWLLLLMAVIPGIAAFLRADFSRGRMSPPNESVQLGIRHSALWGAASCRYFRVLQFRTVNRQNKAHIDATTINCEFASAKTRKLQPRHRRQQRARIFVLGVPQNLDRVALLHDLSLTHDRHAVRHPGHHRDVVRDEQISQTTLFLKVA